MKLKCVLLIALFAICSIQVLAQYNPTIRSGRPGQSIGPFTVGQSVFQVQSGVDFNNIDDSNGTEVNTVLSNTVLRYGFAERWEVSGVMNWQNDDISSNSQDFSQSGISNTQLGFRYLLVQGNGSKPSIGIQYRMLLKAQGEAYKRQNLGSNITLATSSSLFGVLGLITNWGATWDGNDGPVTGSYAINIGFDIAGNLSGFIENYGSLRDGDLASHFDFGLAYLISNDFQLDLYSGWQGREDVKDFFVSFGVSWRVHKR